MRAEDILKSINAADEKLLAECEKPYTKKRNAKAGLAAACIALIVAAGFAFNRSFIDFPAGPISDSSAVTQESQSNLLVFNEIDEYAVADGARRCFPAGYFFEDMTQDDRQKLFPGGMEPEFNGHILFSDEGRAQEIYLYAEAAFKYELTLAQGEVFKCAAFYGGGIKSTELDGNKLSAIKFEKDEAVFLYELSFKLGDIEYLLEAHDVPEALCDAVQREMSDIAKRIIQSGEKGFYGISRSEIPEYFEYEADFSAAAADKQFGELWIQGEPENAHSAYIKRVKSGTAGNYLSGLWDFSSGAYLKYTVREFSENDEAALISSEADREKYDMSLYSLPLADSVPEQLWQWVFNPVFDIDMLTEAVVEARKLAIGPSEDFSIQFCVSYGDKIVEISSKGISADEIYGLLPKR